MHRIWRVIYILILLSQICFGQIGWQTFASPLGNETLGKVQFVNSSEGWINSKSGQLLHTIDGGKSWDVFVLNFKERISFFTDPATAISFVNQSKGWLIGSLKDSLENEIGGVIYNTVDGGSSWSRTFLPDCLQGASIQFIDENIGWVVYLNFSNQGVIMQTLDGGENWSVVHILNDKLGIAYFIDANTGWLWLDSLDSEMDFAPPFEILKTTNGGITWDLQYKNETIAIDARTYFSDKENGWIVGRMQYGSAPMILKTDDGGIIWEEVKSIDMPFAESYNGISVYFLNKDVGWIAARRIDEQGASYIIQTLDGGTTWDLQSTNSEENINSIYFINKYEGWIAGDNGFLAYTKTGGNLTNISKDNSFTGKYYLTQNYPNPFNPSTTIKYSIPKQSNVTLKMFDVLGSEVSTLVSKEQSVGTYEVEFDASELTSGIYFYRLQAGEFVETKKMILLK